MRYNKNLIEKSNSFKKSILKFLKIVLFSTIIIILYNIFLVLLSATAGKETSNIFGYSAYIITTDSMKPTLNVNDVVIIKKVNTKTLKKDDVITFKKESKIITHRIIIKNEDEYTTKGDNNNVEDSFIVRESDILGIKVFKIPFLGKIIKMINNILYILIIIITLITIYLYSRRKNRKKLIRRKKKRFEDEKKK